MRHAVPDSTDNALVQGDGRGRTRKVLIALPLALVLAAMIGVVSYGLLGALVNQDIDGLLPEGVELPSGSSSTEGRPAVPGSSKDDRPAVPEVPTADVREDKVPASESSRYSFSLESAKASSIPGAPDALEAFTFDPDVDPLILTSWRTTAIEEALAPLEEVAPVGFVFFDFTTGRGVAYNAQEAIYPASSMKAPFCYHVLTSGEDIGEADLDNMVQAIIYSDNDAYDALCFAHADSFYYGWLEDKGLDQAAIHADFYPRMSAAQMAEIWFEICDYIGMTEGVGIAPGSVSTGTIGGTAGAAEAADLVHALGIPDVLVQESTALLKAAETGAVNSRAFSSIILSKPGTSRWFKELLSKTTVSFIRDGLGSQVRVFNKAGWISEYPYYAVCDAGVLENGSDGRRYLMVIMTGQPDDVDAEARVANLAKVLFEQLAG